LQSKKFAVYNATMGVLVVGSSLFDAIVSLEDNPHVTVADNKATFALGGKIPVDIKAFSTGGNAANVASALQKLNTPNALYTYIGQDALSQFIAKKLADEHITVYEHSIEAQTGPLSIIFDFREDRAIFSHHPEYDHPFDETKVLEIPSHIFLTSIGRTWENGYRGVLAYARRNNIPVAFSPGSQQMKDINETFIATVHQSKMLFCNMEEARLIHEKLSGVTTEDMKEFLLDLKNYGFELLSITDGANGSYAVDNNNTVYKVGVLPTQGHEKTGAGDAYAGAFMAALLEGHDIPTCMKHGALNSVGVMSHVGAHTGQLTKSEMEERANRTDFPATTL